jgi:hypothetical protein
VISPLSQRRCYLRVDGDRVKPSRHATAAISCNGWEPRYDIPTFVGVDPCLRKRGLESRRYLAQVGIRDAPAHLTNRQPTTRSIRRNQHVCCICIGTSLLKGLNACLRSCPNSACSNKKPKRNSREHAAHSAQYKNQWTAALRQSCGRRTISSPRKIPNTLPDSMCGFMWAMYLLRLMFQLTTHFATHINHGILRAKYLRICVSSFGVIFSR